MFYEKKKANIITIKQRIKVTITFLIKEMIVFNLRNTYKCYNLGKIIPEQVYMSFFEC